MKPTSIITCSCLALAAAFLVALRFEHIVTSLAYACGIAVAIIAVVALFFASSSNQHQIDDDGLGTLILLIFAAFFGGTIAGAYLAVRAMAIIDIGFIATASVGCGLLGKMITDKLIKYCRDDPSDCDQHIGSVLFQIGITMVAIGFFLHAHPISFPEHIQVAFDRHNPLIFLVPGQFSNIQQELYDLNAELTQAAIAKLVTPLSVFLSACTIFDHLTTPK
jgi:hypothetical protein